MLRAMVVLVNSTYAAYAVKKFKKGPGKKRVGLNSFATNVADQLSAESPPITKQEAWHMLRSVRENRFLTCFLAEDFDASELAAVEVKSQFVPSLCSEFKVLFLRNLRIPLSSKLRRLKPVC
jgi:hypothetical protein